jgi:hypothetical protein
LTINNSLIRLLIFRKFLYRNYEALSSKFILKKRITSETIA